MGFWNIFSSDGEKHAQIGAEILDRPRAGYYPVESTKESDKVVKNATFEMIQGSIVEEINKVHNKINNVSEQDLKIQELKSKLETFKSDNEQIYTKIKDLKSVGLVNTPSAVKVLNELEVREESITGQINNLKREIADLEKIKLCVNKYLLKYPSFKFIDTKTFINILRKYDLVLGESSLYAKEIPDNVLTNILKFKDDINKDKTYVHLYTYGRYTHRDYIVKTSSSEYINCHMTGSDEHYRTGNSKDLRSIYSYCKTNLAIAAPINHFKNDTITVEQRWEDKNKTININILSVDQNSRQLIINIDDFRLNAEKNNEFEKSMVQDPIACLRVPEGFIIIDAWEKEALIPEIQRETLN